MAGQANQPPTSLEDSLSPETLSQIAQISPDQTTQWVLIGVIALSVVAALFSVAAQRVIAKKRAAYDHMVTIKKDATHLDEQRTFVELVDSKQLESVINARTSHELQQRESVRNYLNDFELLCASIEHHIIDEDVCKAFMYSTIIKRWNDAQPLIAKIRTWTDSGGKRATYEYFERIARRWQDEPSFRYRGGVLSGMRKLFEELFRI